MISNNSVHRECAAAVTGIAVHEIQEFETRQGIIIEILPVQFHLHADHFARIFLHRVIGRKIRLLRLIQRDAEHGIRSGGMAETTIHLQGPAVRIHAAVELPFRDILRQYFQILVGSAIADGGRE